MTTSKRLKTAIALSITGVLVGCASGASPGGGAKGLSLGQIDAVTLAARKMVGDEAAQVHGLKSNQSPVESGVHVCGYVKASAHGEIPLYVELRKKNDIVAAERGQVGTDPQSLAKVKFMCRQHRG